MCPVLCSTVLLRETRAEVYFLCGDGFEDRLGEWCFRSCLGVSVVQPPLLTEQSVVIYNMIGLPQHFI